jgi:predicted DCC family thiol-disulfide oxidoreductase YuxK
MISNAAAADHDVQPVGANDRASGHRAEGGGTQPEQEATQPIVFFDGVCGLCNRFVDFVLPRDRREVFRFAPLQGETARRLIDRADIDSLKSILLCDGRGVHRQSTAVVRILYRLGGVWKVIAVALWLIPRPIRDLGYKLIARSRYRLFGKREACRLPTPDERRRFLP